MAIIVQKYGGSSVADVAKIGLVADKVAAAKRAGHDVVVVVSAMGKTTDELLLLAKGVAGDAPLPRRELDMLVSTGERVTMALLSIAIHARGHEAISFTGSQSGILTNDRHFDARIIEVRPHRIEDELSRGRIVIVAGYQGMSYRREITTLGRGGTDTTAVALAAALGADRCEIYSDVDGVYSADPRVVDDPAHLPEIDLAVLQEMAEAGAKVVNAQAVEWARRNKIVIHARRTADVGDGARETIARDTSDARPALDASAARSADDALDIRDPGREARTVRAVVGLDRVVVVRSSEPLRRLADALAAHRVPTLDVTATPPFATALVPLLNLPDWERCRAQLHESLRGVELVEDAALVSVVGAELGHALPRFLAVLDDAGIAPLTVTATQLRLGAAIPRAHLNAAQRALHAAFVV